MLYAYNKWTRKPFPAPAALARGGLALIVLVFGWLALTEVPELIRHPAQLQAAAPRELAPAIAQPKPLRLVYRNSVIPGGVHSAAELALALLNDPVAAAHYAGFNVAAAHVVRVERSRLVHVSYRVGDKIYWTKNKVRLEVGERLLSDGEHLVRARCGNRIADVALGPTLDNEPAPEVLDALMLSADDLIDQSPYLPTESHAGALAAVSVAHPPAARATPAMPGLSPWPLVGLFPSSLPALPRFAPPVSGTVPATGSPQPQPGGVPAGPGADMATPPPAAPPVPDSVTPPTVPPPLPDSPANFPLDPPIGPQPQAPADVPAAPNQIPEPGSAALAAVALAVLALIRRRAPRRRASQNANSQA